MEKTKKTNILTGLAAFLGSVMTILGAVWFLGKPVFEKEVKKVFINELNGAEVELFFDAKAKVKEQEYKERIKQNSGKSFRVLCGEKLGVPFDESHIEIGNLKKSIEELREQVKELKDCCTTRGRNQMTRL